MNNQQRLAAQRRQHSGGAASGVQNLNRANPNQQQQQQQQGGQPQPQQQQGQQQQMQLPPGLSPQHAAILQQQQQIINSGGQLTQQQMQLRQQIFMRMQQQQEMLRAQSRADAFLTETEVDGFEQSDDSTKGAGFRKILAILLVMGLLFLAGAKFLDEATLVEPGVDGNEATVDQSTAGVAEDVKADQSSFLSRLGLSKEDSFTEKPKNRKETSEEKTQRMRDNWEKKKKIEEHLRQIKDEQNALVYCGQECQDSGKQVQAAYDALAARIERPLTEALFGEDESSKININRLTDKQIREQYEKQKKHIEETTEEGSSDRAMWIAELKDAAEIMQNTDARRYYLMYNQKPPEHTKHAKATHGGWGQELALKTFRNRIIMGWLQHLDSGWADYSVIAIVLGIGYLIPMIFTIPKAIAIAEQMVDEHEKMENLENEAREQAELKKDQ